MNTPLMERKIFLEKELEKNDKLYNLGKPEITDTEYDKMFFELKDINKSLNIENDIKITSDSTSGKEKIKHINKTLSLDKVKELTDLRKWLEKMPQECSFVVQLKMDGLTINDNRNIYPGEKMILSTRGDGTLGENVTENLKEIVSIPVISTDDKMIVRGEAIIPFEDFERVNKNGEYASPRNLASGTINGKDTTLAKERGVKFIAFDLVESEFDTPTEITAIDELKKLGYQTVETWDFGKNTEEARNKIIDFCSTYNDKERSKLPYLIDGLVIKVNEYALRKELGETNKHPKWAIAFKFESQNAITKLIDVRWQLGRSGILTPVGILEPCDIDGVEISKASLANLNNIEARDILLNDFVLVERANDVIPKITQAVKKDQRTDLNKKIEAVEKCPICGSETIVVFNNENKAVYCSEKENCRGVEVEKLKYFVGKDVMNIRDLGDETIETLYNMNYIKRIDDLYLLKYVETLKEENGFGKRSIEKMIENIEATKNRPNSFSKSLLGLSIPNVGNKVTEHLAATYTDFETLYEKHLNKTLYNELIQVDGFGEVIVASVENIFTPKNLDILKYLQRYGVVLKEEKEDVTFEIDGVELKTDFFPLKDLSIVITGKLSTSRKEFEKMIEVFGGKLSKTVNSKTDFLVVGGDKDKEANSSKYKKAVSLNTAIISEEELLAKTK